MHWICPFFYLYRLHQVRTIRFTPRKLIFSPQNISYLINLLKYSLSFIHKDAQNKNKNKKLFLHISSLVINLYTVHQDFTLLASHLEKLVKVIFDLNFHYVFLKLSYNLNQNLQFWHHIVIHLSTSSSSCLKFGQNLKITCTIGYLMQILRGPTPDQERNFSMGLFHHNWADRHVYFSLKKIVEEKLLHKYSYHVY